MNTQILKVELFSVPISITSQSGVLAIITQWVIGRSLHPSSLRPEVVVTPNPEMIVAAQKDPEFLKALQSADLAIPDGVGVVAAMRLLRAKGQGPIALIPSRISGISLMEDLIALAARHGWRVMLLGGKPGVAAGAARILRERFTNNDLRITGINGPDDITHASPRDLNNLINAINVFSPDLLFVAFGHGKQEKWMARYRNRLDVGVMMGVGGALDQIVDPTLRPPAIIDSMGLGWLYRLLREPWRVRRQLALLKFTAMVFRVFVRSI